MPKDYQVSFTQKVEGRSGSKSNKVVNKILLSPSNKAEVLIDIERSLDQYQGLRPQRDTSYIAYTIRDTSTLNLAEIRIEYDSKQQS